MINQAPGWIYPDPKKSQIELEQLIETQKSVIAHMAKRQHEADEVIDFYAGMWNWNKSADKGEIIENFAIDNSDAEWMDGGDMKANYWGGKRAREYQSKYEAP